MPDSMTIATSESLTYFIKADAFRQTAAEFSWSGLIKNILLRRTFRPVVTLRLCQASARSSGLLRLALPMLKILHRINTDAACIDLPWKTKIQAGFCITHGWGLVVSEGAVIGKNVTLFHGVTLGRRDRILPDGRRSIECPTLEDEVWVGPHAIIVGGVTIGRGSRIAGGSFVTADVPPFSSVGGNPAIVLKSNCIPDVMNRVAI